MADLKNSQRISYKATYTQISPTATTRSNGSTPTKSLLRAVEKTAFVQSLRMIPQELAVLRKQLSGRGDVGAYLPAALSAIEQLVNDNTGTSTLNNATLFAKIDASTLVAVATELIAHRQVIADGIDKNVAEILSAYRAT